MGVGFAFLLLVLIAGLIKGYGAIWGEQEGDIRIADCRTKVPVKEGSYETWFKKFTCSYKRTNSGKLLYGTCAAVETDGAACLAAYVYDKKPEIVCNDPKFPFPEVDDRCHSIYE